MISSENHFLHLEIEPVSGSFSMHPNDATQPRIEGARLGVEYRLNGRLKIRQLNQWNRHGVWERVEFPGIGFCQSQKFSAVCDLDSVTAEIEFALPENRPLLLWKINLTYNGILPLQVKRLVFLQANTQLDSGNVSFAGANTSQLGFYSNGWQSWSHTSSFRANEFQPQSRLGIFQNPMITNPGTLAVEKQGHFSSDMFGVLVDLKNRTGLLVGFLSQLNHFGSIQAILNDKVKLTVWANGDSTRLDSGQTMESDWAVLYPLSLETRSALDEYLDTVAQYHHVNSAEVLTGWCSWYYYYTKLSSMDISENLSQTARLSDQIPLQLVQIDDGFEAQVGDWLEFKPGFPDGVGTLAQAIKIRGNIPGLWLAPFIVHPRSKLYKQHPEWLLRNRSGRLTRAGFVWNSFPAALDLTVPHALDYVSQIISTAVHEWGFPYLKLDFLYAAALKGTYQTPGRTRAQVLRQGIEAIRKAAGPDAYLLGCGLPLGSGLGLIQAMRVSADVGGSWLPSFFHIQAPFKTELCMPSARNAIHNSITRAPLHHKWWVNDPDCLLVRPEMDLTLAEVQTLASIIAMTGGALLVSDDLSQLPADRLEIIQKLLPVIGQRAWVIDLFDERQPRRLRLDLDGPSGSWHLLSWSNWEDHQNRFLFKPSEYGLPEGHYTAVSFWDGRLARINSAKEFDMGIVPPHGTVVIAVRPHLPELAGYLGGNIHISQGCELSSWESHPDFIRFRFELPRQANGDFYLALPRDPNQTLANSISISPRVVAPGIFQYTCEFHRSLQVEIQF